MSHALYSTALLWHVTRGVAKLHGVLAAVGEPLMLMGRRVAEIDYIPELHVPRVQSRSLREEASLRI